MKKFFSNGGNIALSICEIIIGILLFINPKGFTTIIIRVVGAVLVVAGVIFAVQYFREDPLEAHLKQGLTKALLSLGAGLFCLFKAEWFLVTFPIVTVLYGVVMVILGIVRIQSAVDMLRMKTGHWILAALGAVVSIVFGIIILMNPFSWTEFLWTFVAISMIVNAIFDICTALFFKNA